MSVWMWIFYWWAGLTMEEVFLVTWGGIIVPPMLWLIVSAIVWHWKQKHAKVDARTAKRKHNGGNEKMKKVISALLVLALALLAVGCHK